MLPRPLCLSVKTRLGIAEPEEFGPILEIYNRYPLSELIVHLRVQRDVYRHPVRTEAGGPILAASRHPVCYNGGLVQVRGCLETAARFPGAAGEMIGQGLLANPALVRQVKGGAPPDRETLRVCHKALFEGYCHLFGSAHNAMMRMKELWPYLIRLFSNSAPAAKALRKAREPRQFLQAADAVFQDLALLPEADWSARSKREHTDLRVLPSAVCTAQQSGGTSTRAGGASSAACSRLEQQPQAAAVLASSLTAVSAAAAAGIHMA